MPQFMNRQIFLGGEVPAVAHQGDHEDPPSAAKVPTNSPNSASAAFYMLYVIAPTDPDTATRRIVEHLCPTTHDTIYTFEPGFQEGGNIHFDYAKLADLTTELTRLRSLGKP